MPRTLLPLTLLAAAAVSPARTQELGLQQVLDRHYQAIGGIEKTKAVRSMRMTGRMIMAQGMEASFTRWAKRPNKTRLEFTVQGMTGIQAYDGETAWMLMPFMGRTAPEVMPADMAKQMIEDADFDGPLVDYQQKGHGIELAGKEQVEGSDAYKLKVTLKSGDVSYYYLDSEYFLPIRMTAKRTIQGTEVEVSVTYGDFKEVGGLTMPHSVRISGSGPGEQTLIIERVELDVQLDDLQFHMPNAPGPGTRTPPGGR